MRNFLSIACLLTITPLLSARTLDIYWVDAEGGAATLIVTPAGESVLIDSGNPGQRDPQRIAKVATEQAGLRRIDHLITTHYHGDHFGGASTLAKLIPIGKVYDNGRFENMPNDPGPDYWEFPAAERGVLKPGDQLDLKVANGRQLVLRCLGARKQFLDAAAETKSNETNCSALRPKERDGSDNANSIAMILEYEGFRFLDNGDLTWNQEAKLVCPKNVIGEVDVYQVTHHGLDSSNNPVLLRSVHPTVSIMNNGVTKGCLPEVFANLKAAKSIQAMYQVHKNLRPDGAVNNAPDDYIANLEEKCRGNFIKLSVSESGENYTISIPAKNHSRTFKTKAASSASMARSDRFSQDQQVLLWPDGTPGAKGTEVVDQPALTIHYPDSEANGTAVVVNPGGGYRVLASDHEGLQVAREMNRNGITAFVLRYRLGPKYSPSESLADAKRAIRLVRHHAKEFGIASDRIGMMGFSAGGHLASSAGTQFDAGNQESDDPIERVSSRPDFLGLVYPVISGELREKTSSYRSTDVLVTSETPPTFMVHTHEDQLTPNHSVKFYQALLKKKISAELHVFGYGSHGLGLAPGDPDLAQWPKLWVNWLRRSNLLTDDERVSVSGKITVAGKPIFWGWLTLRPKNKYAPVATAYIHQSKDGSYSIDKEHGPTPGEYRVEIRSVARDFSQPQSGKYSMNDAELAGHPGDSEDLTIVIKASGENRFDFQL